VDFRSGTVQAGPDKAEPLCPVPESGVTVKNHGSRRAWLGGPGVADGNGYPLDPGDSESIPGTEVREAPVVPAPSGHGLPVLYARSAPGDGPVEVSWIAVAAQVPE
jgi:hypothetical protein